MKRLDMMYGSMDAPSTREYDQTINDNFDEVEEELNRLGARIQASSNRLDRADNDLRKECALATAAIHRLTRRVDDLERTQTPPNPDVTGFERYESGQLLDKLIFATQPGSGMTDTYKRIRTELLRRLGE